jgi:nitroreductase
MRDFLDVITSRKSVRSFDSRAVSRQQIEEILRVATYAPTNCNQQLWNFIVIDDRAILERLVREAASSTILRRVPATIVVTYDGWNYKEAIQGASLALGNILLAAEYYGLATGPMNSYGADTQIKRILGIPQHETICCFVNIGYPSEKAKKEPNVPRRNVQDTIHWGHFEKRSRPTFSYEPNDWTLENLRSHQQYYCRKTFPGKEMDMNVHLPKKH